MYLYERHKDDTKKHNNSVGKDTDLIEVAYWRKHPDLHCFIEDIWRKKKPKEAANNSFNCIYFKLSKKDLKAILKATKNRKMVKRTGFFFGYSSDYQYKETIKIFKDALEQVDKYDFYYYSWW